MLRVIGGVCNKVEHFRLGPVRIPLFPGDLVQHGQRLYPHLHHAAGAQVILFGHHIVPGVHPGGEGFFKIGLRPLFQGVYPVFIGQFSLVRSDILKSFSIGHDAGVHVPHTVLFKTAQHLFGCRHTHMLHTGGVRVGAVHIPGHRVLPFQATAMGFGDLRCQLFPAISGIGLGFPQLLAAGGMGTALRIQPGEHGGAAVFHFFSVGKKFHGLVLSLPAGTFPALLPYRGNTPVIYTFPA